MDLGSETHQHVLGYCAPGLLDLGSAANHPDDFLDRLVVDQTVLVSEQGQLYVIVVAPQDYFGDWEVDFSISVKVVLWH